MRGCGGELGPVHATPPQLCWSDQKASPTVSRVSIVNSAIAR